MLGIAPKLGFERSLVGLWSNTTAEMLLGQAKGTMKSSVDNFVFIVQV
jgi:hypothetical protein